VSSHTAAGLCPTVNAPALAKAQPTPGFQLETTDLKILMDAWADLTRDAKALEATVVAPEHILHPLVFGILYRHVLSIGPPKKPLATQATREF